MPATNQSAVSTLIREVLADPDLAHDDVFRRLLQAGLRACQCFCVSGFGQRWGLIRSG